MSLKSLEFSSPVNQAKQAYNHVLKHGPDHDNKRLFFNLALFLFAFVVMLNMMIILLIYFCFLLDLLQPVLFSLYGNQCEPREEHLLLTMFQVGYRSYY